jgi:hypothetical protein
MSGAILHQLETANTICPIQLKIMLETLKQANFKQKRRLKKHFIPGQERAKTTAKLIFTLTNRNDHNVRCELKVYG